MIYYTGSPALYRKSRLIQEVPPTPEVPPYTGSPAPLYRKSRPYTESPAHLSINHFDRWCMVLTTCADYIFICYLSLSVEEM